MAAVRSPCVNICALDDNDICIGCDRSAGEISRWSLMSDEERRQVLRRCHPRALASGRLTPTPTPT